jgi:hypothetical protein
MSGSSDVWPRHVDSLKPLHLARAVTVFPMPRCVSGRRPEGVANAVQSPSARRHCGYRCYERRRPEKTPLYQVVMLRNNEPYRYANPATTQQKLSRLRVAVTGKIRKPEHKGRRPGVKNGANPPSRLVPSLERVCRQEGLPPVHGFKQLPVAEQRVLKTMGVIDFVQQLGTDRRIPCSVRAKNDRKEPEKALA